MSTIRIVIPSLYTGGTEMHLLHIVPKLIAKGFQIRLLVFSPDQTTMITQLQKAGAHICFLERPARWFRPVPALITAIFLLCHDMCQHRHDITHFFLPKAYLIGMLCALITFSPAPLVMSRRSLNDYQKSRRFLRWLEHKFHAKTSYITTNSQAAFDQLIQEEQADPQRLHLIYNGIDAPETEDGYTLRQSYDIPAHALVLVKIANLIPYKGHLDLIEALASIKTQLPSPWILLCIGFDQQQYLHHLQQVAQRLKVQHNIRWITDQPQAIKLLPMADISLLTSHQEGFANANIEAMVCAKPIIATDVGGNKETILHQKTGLIVPAHCPTQLAEAINLLSHNSTLREQMGQAGYQRWQQNFSLEHCIQAYLALYNTIKENSPCVV